MPTAGVFLSEADLRNLTRAAEVLHDPFGFGTLDGWRHAVNERLVETVGAEAAIFFLLPSVDGGADGREAVFSSELSSDQRADFVRFALHDAGSDRALAHGHSVMTQRALVGDDWDAYFTDAAVNAFYLPNHLVDSIGLLLWDQEGRKEASIEMHRGDFGTPLFGREGAARLAILLPALRASVAAVRAIQTARQGVEALLDALSQPVALADAKGRLTFRSVALSGLLASDPDSARLWSALAQFAATQSALFEGRGGGRGHRTAVASLEAAATATVTVETRAGRYLLSVVETPAAISGGRHGFLLRVEPMFASTLTPAAAQTRFNLTVRELQVARLLGAGKRNDVIAAALGISPHTARRHTEKVLRKLDVKSRSAVALVLRGGG